MTEPNDDLVGADQIEELADDPLLTELRRTQQAIVAERSEREAAIAEESRDRRRGARRNLWGAMAGVVAGVVALWLSVSTVQVQRQQDEDRRASRLVTCQDANEKTDDIAGVTRALLRATNESTEPRTPQQIAERERALKGFLDDQGLKLSADGKVLAAYMDCDLFQEDPTAARAQRTFMEHAPE